MTYLKASSNKNGLSKYSNTVAGEFLSTKQENTSACSISDKQFAMSNKTTNFL